jgi:chromosome segregation ATPase
MTGLHLTRLRVAQLRKFRQPFELGDLSPGLNLFTGPNEAGKSTLVRAIRAAFFERHRSTSVDDLQPWDDPSATPSVELEFQWQGQAHRLSKRFLGKKRCLLHIDGLVRDGTEAEDHLAQLFGFQFAGKGASKAEHWGIPGLLWVEQGTGQVLREAAGHARDHLHDALQGLIGTTTAGDRASGGDTLLARLRAQRDELLTGTGRPRAAHAAAIEQVKALATQVEDWRTKLTDYREAVDRLGALRDQHRREEADRPWEALRAERVTTEQRRHRLQALQDELARDTARHHQQGQTHQLLLAQIDAHRQHTEALVQRQQALADADAQCLLADDTLNARQAHAQAVQATVTEARDHLHGARQEDNRRHLLDRQAQAQTAALRTREALQQAVAAQAQLHRLLQAAAASAITDDTVQGLRQKLAHCREQTLRREAVATRLSFTLQAGQQVHLDGQALHGTGEHWLSASATLRMAGVGELTIHPGGHGLGELARAEAAAHDDLQAALQRAGLRDLAEAEHRLAVHRDRLTEIGLAEQTLRLIAPRGLDALHAEAAQATTQQQSAQAQLDRLPARQADAPELSLAQAEARLAAAEEVAAQVRTALSLAEQQQALCRSRQADARRELSTVQRRLDDPVRQQRLVEARTQLLACTAEREALSARLASLQLQIQAERPDLLAQDIDRLTRSIAVLEQAHQARHEQILKLETQLQIAGAQQLEDDLDKALGELARAQHRQIQLQRRAQALEVLCQRLDAKRQATIARLQAPLQKHLQHYLPLLFPGARLQLDEQLVPGTLTRADRTGSTEAGDFRELSFGAREQLGLLSRFAYADLLREAGRPTLLILDDALVHSDDARFAQMKRVLFDVAQRHQVLLFSCHPGLWRDVGVAVRELMG